MTRPPDKKTIGRFFPEAKAQPAGVEVKESSGTARPFCEALQARGILAKETHHQVIRFAPPLVIDKETLEWALGHVREVLA